MENFMFSPWNTMGYKTETAVLQDRQIKIKNKNKQIKINKDKYNSQMWVMTSFHN